MNGKNSKEKRIKKEIIRLKKIYKNVNEDKMKLIMELINRASFLLIMAQDMEKDIVDLEDFTIEIINSTQTFTKTNPLLKDYRDTIKSYQAILKQLNDFTKDEIAIDKDDEFTTWLNK